MFLSQHTRAWVPLLSGNLAFCMVFSSGDKSRKPTRQIAMPILIFKARFKYYPVEMNSTLKREVKLDRFINEPSEFLTKYSRSQHKGLAHNQSSCLSLSIPFTVRSHNQPLVLGALDCTCFALPIFFQYRQFWCLHKQSILPVSSIHHSISQTTKSNDRHNLLVTSGLWCTTKPLHAAAIDLTQFFKKCPGSECYSGTCTVVWKIPRFLLGTNYQSVYLSILQIFYVSLDCYIPWPLFRNWLVFTSRCT